LSLTYLRLGIGSRWFNNPAAHRPWRYVPSLPEERDNYIFYAGGANLHKGPHISLRAFKLLREWGVDVELVMTGTVGTHVEALARRYGVGQEVRFLGRLPEGMCFRLMAGAGATILLSVRLESLPTVTVESWVSWFSWRGLGSASAAESVLEKETHG
jgi:glycosyltransferase involved in cell wall biosynthesis